MELSIGFFMPHVIDEEKIVWDRVRKTDMRDGIREPSKVGISRRYILSTPTPQRFP